MPQGHRWAKGRATPGVLSSAALKVCSRLNDSKHSSAEAHLQYAAHCT